MTNNLLFLIDATIVNPLACKHWLNYKFASLKCKFASKQTKVCFNDCNGKMLFMKYLGEFKNSITVKFNITLFLIVNQRSPSYTHHKS